MTLSNTLTALELPLKSLVVHPQNVRAPETTAAPNAIAALAANIRAVGLLQPLLVQELSKGRYGVLAGARRLAALQALASDRKEKAFTAKMAVRCQLVARDAAATAVLSLSENEMQLPMDALSRYEAFAALRATGGLDPAGIAGIFGVSERAVRETLRIGLVAPEIREAHRADDITLDTLKAFTGHPDPAVQLAVFTALSDAQGSLQAWQVRNALDARGVKIGEALGAFVLEDYRAAAGEIAADLIEEESVLCDPGLVQSLLAAKLDDLAEERRAALGFAWAEHRIDPDWLAFADYDRVTPQPCALDAKTQARVDKLTAKLDAIAEAHDSAEDWDAQAELEAAHDALSARIDGLTTAWSESDLQRAGIIAIWQHGRLDLRVGLVRPEDCAAIPELKLGADGKQAGEEVGPKMSNKLLGDLAVERARAVGVALAGRPDQARLYADWLIVSSILPACRARVQSSLRFSAATYAPNEVHTAKSPAALEAAFGSVEVQTHAAEAGLPLDWAGQNDPVAGFVALAAEDRDRLVAWAVSRTLEPVASTAVHDPMRAAIEAAVLPDLRTLWRPDARLLKRLTKPDLLRILRDDLEMGQKADTLAGAKKSEIVEKLDALFGGTDATLSAAQSAALARWCPPGMQTVCSETACPERGDASEPAESDVPAAPEVFAAPEVAGARALDAA